MLSNFQLGGRVLFQSFLLGQVEFRNTIQAKGLEQLRQRVIAAYHLEALDEEQTRGYIEHRLRTAGWTGDPKFTDAAYADIYKYSGGVPRRINTLCDRLLLFGVLEEIHEFDADKVNTVVQELKNETSSEDFAVTPPLSESKENDKPMDKKSSGTLTAKRSQPTARSGSAQTTKPLPADADVETRLAHLEQRVIDLEESLRRETARLRRAIILSDDFGEV